MTLFEFFCITIFSCFALSVSAGFVAGRWYERTSHGAVLLRPSFVPERAHPERTIPVPLPGRRHLAVVANPDVDGPSVA